MHVRLVRHGSRVTVQPLSSDSWFLFQSLQGIKLINQGLSSQVVALLLFVVPMARVLSKLLLTLTTADTASPKHDVVDEYRSVHGNGSSIYVMSYR